MLFFLAELKEVNTGGGFYSLGLQEFRLVC
jgi:hypothetical protein